MIDKCACARTYDLPQDKTNRLTVRPAKTQISLGVLTVWSESSLCAQWVAKEGPTLSSCRQRRLWSGWVDAQADLGLRWAHISFCWFCLEAAHIILRETSQQRKQTCKNQWGLRDRILFFFYVRPILYVERPEYSSFWIRHCLKIESSWWIKRFSGNDIPILL